MSTHAYHESGFLLATAVQYLRMRYVARQPIFNRGRKVYGYELLFRSGTENFFRSDNFDKASSSVINDSIFVGGQFTTAGGRPAANVALWNGAGWSGLGSGVAGTVNTVCFTERLLYVGGNFTTAGGVTANAIARWNGLQWKDLAGGLSGYVNAIHPAASWGGGIVVGGSFTGPITNLGWFNDEQWVGIENVVAASSVDAEVRSIAMYDKRLFIGGTFTSTYPKDLEGGNSSGVSTPYVARYEGMRISNYAWNGLRRGTNGYVNALAVDGSNLYVGGEFTQVSGIPANHIARWDQVNWYPMGALIGNAIRSIVVRDNDVYVGWNSSLPGSGLYEGHLLRWNDEGWTEIDGTIGGELMTAASHQDDIYVGGAFTTAKEEITVNIARLDVPSETWSAINLGSGVAGGAISYVDAVAVDGDKIYMAGEFTIADTIPARNVALYDRRTGRWSSLGAGLNGAVRALALAPNGDLYAGGDFRLSGTDSMRNIARWDGTAWRPLGKGADDIVLALAFDGDNLYVGGEFDTIDGRGMQHVARWNLVERSWSPLGDGIGGDFGARVSALTVYKGMLYAAGTFPLAGGDTASGIARWNGSSWSALGSGINGSAAAIAVRNGEILVGGSFTEAGTRPSLFFGMWHEPAAGILEEKIPFAIPITGAPNPATARTAIRFRSETPGEARMTMVDMLGREIAVLLNDRIEAGDHTITWDASTVPNGIYTCILTLNQTAGTTRITILH